MAAGPPGDVVAWGGMRSHGDDAPDTEHGLSERPGRRPTWRPIRRPCRDDAAGRGSGQQRRSQLIAPHVARAGLGGPKSALYGSAPLAGRAGRAVRQRLLALAMRAGHGGSLDQLLDAHRQPRDGECSNKGGKQVARRRGLEKPPGWSRGPLRYEAARWSRRSWSQVRISLST